MNAAARLAPCSLCLVIAAYAPTAPAQALASPSWGSAQAPRRAVATPSATPPASPPAPVTFMTRPSAPHALYVEANYLGAMGSLGVSYAFRPLRGLAVSVGFGESYMKLLGDEWECFGGQVMVHGLFGGAGASSLEIAGGAAVVVAEGSASLLVQGRRDNGELGVSPAAFLGYRHQPLDGGILFRLGAAWSYGNGVGASVSLGGAF